MNTLTTPRILADSDRALLELPLTIKDGMLTLFGRTDDGIDSLFKTDLSQSQKQIVNLYLPTEEQVENQDVALFHVPVSAILHTGYYNTKVRQYAGDNEMAMGVRFQIITATHVYTIDVPTRDVEIADKTARVKNDLAKAIHDFGRTLV